MGGDRRVWYSGWGWEGVAQCSMVQDTLKLLLVFDQVPVVDESG